MQIEEFSEIRVNNMPEKHNKLKILSFFVRKLKRLSNYFYSFSSKKNGVSVPKYRLLDWVTVENDKNLYCEIQIIGTINVFKKTPSEILKKDKFIFSFSQKDVCIITTLAHLALNKPSLKILGIDFLDNLVTLKRENEKAFDIKIHEFKKNKILISELTPQDAFRIGQFVGDQDSLVRI